MSGIEVLPLKEYVFPFVIQTKEHFWFHVLTLTTEIFESIQRQFLLDSRLGAEGEGLSLYQLPLSFTAYLKIRTASHYMDLHSNTQPIYLNFTLSSSEARLLTIPVISKM